MNTIVEKTKRFLKKHRTHLIVGGVILTAATICRVTYVYNIRKSYVKWAIQGAVIGFQGAIDWFDSEFEDLNLRGIYTEWSKEHPEEILTV